MRIAIVAVLLTVLIILFLYHLVSWAKTKSREQTIKEFSVYPRLLRMLPVTENELYILEVELEDGEIIEFAALHPEGESYPDPAIKNTLV